MPFVDQLMGMIFGRTKRDAALLLQSGLFDLGFYASHVGAHEKPSLLQFLKHGWRRGLSPSPFFDSVFYTLAYADVKKAGLPVHSRRLSEVLAGKPRPVRYDLLFRHSLSYGEPVRTDQGSRGAHRPSIFVVSLFPPQCNYSVMASSKQVYCDGLQVTFYELVYVNTSYGKFWGGNMPTASWLTKETSNDALRISGLSLHSSHQHGPCVTATALRRAGAAPTYPIEC